MPAADFAGAGGKAPAKPLPSHVVPASVMRMMAPRLARPKAPDAAAVGSQLTPQAASPAAPSGWAEFSVEVALTPHRLLGVDVDWSDGRTLFVKAVQPGALEDWNSERGPQLSVRPGDRIVAVNGISGDAEAMVRECRGGGRRQLRLLVRTRRRPVGAPKAVAEEDGASSPSRGAKRPRTAEELYSWLPAPDPEKDAVAARADAGPEAPDPRRVIFLDIDGVLRRLEEGTTISVDGETLPLGLAAQSRAFAPEALQALRHVVHRTGAGVVLSSEWRRSAPLREEAATALRAVGLPPLRGATPVLGAREEVVCKAEAATLRLRWAERRAREISFWLRRHPEVSAWVAIDDISLDHADEVRLPETLWMAPSLVRTAPSVGLTMSHARRAVELLLKR